TSNSPWHSSHRNRVSCNDARSTYPAISQNLNCSEQKAAIDQNAAAGHVTRSLGSKKDHCSIEIGWLCETLERDAVADAFTLSAGKKFIVQWCHDVARSNHVRANAAERSFQRDGSGQQQQAGFRSAVG